MTAGGPSVEYRLKRFAQYAKRSATRTVSTLGGRVNFRVATTALLGLVTVVAFLAIGLPLWVPVTTVAVALAIGVLDAGGYGWRLCIAATVFVIAVGAGADWIGHGSSPAAPHRTSPWVPVGGGLEASLEAQNLTYEPQWGSTIEADAYDELQFRLVINNPTRAPSPARIIRLTASEDSEGPRLIAATFGSAREGPFESGPEVKVIPQSNGVDGFHARTPVIGEPSSSAELLTAIGDFLPWTGLSWAYQYDLPPISAHSRLLVSFMGSFDTPEEPAVLGGGSVVSFKNLNDQDSTYGSTVAAVPGDTLSAYGELNNTTFRSTTAHARIQIDDHHHRSYDTVALYISQYSGAERELGHGTVNAGSSQPISLQLVPGTTEVRTAKSNCSKETRESLPDGVTEGGVEITGIGGFRPRDPCHGIEFAKYLFFRLKVVAEGREAS